MNDDTDSPSHSISVRQSRSIVLRHNALVARGLRDIAQFGNRARANEFVKLGNSCYHKREYDQAIADYSEAIRLDPEYAMAYYYRGVAYGDKGDYDAAVADCTEAVRLDPKCEPCCNSVAYALKRKFDSSIADSAEPVRLDDEERLAQQQQPPAESTEVEKAGEDVLQELELRQAIARAMAEELDKRWKEEAKAKADDDAAIADYTEAIRLDPGDAEAYYNRGVIYAHKGDYDAAVADYTEAIRLDPGDATAYYNRGFDYGKIGDYPRAIAYYSEAIRLGPGDATAYFARGNAYGEIGDHTRAIADYSEAIRLDPEDATAYYYRGISYLKMGDRAKAEADFADANRLGY